MTATPAAKPAARKPAVSKAKTVNASTQARFATSKLIQNLGSGDGMQFSFVGDLRDAHGRD